MDYPSTPPGQLLFVVFNVRGEEVGRSLDVIGERMRSEQVVDAVLPDGRGGLTMHLGVGAKGLRVLGSPLSAEARLPLFAGDARVPRRLREGDLVLNLASNHGVDLAAVCRALVRDLPLDAVWQQHGVRGPGEGAVARNPLGFLDGIQVPRETSEIDTAVWRETEAGEITFGAVRRLQLDVARFLELPVARQEEVIGRKRGDGAPLSGGVALGPVDLLAKTAAGDYLVPVRSHARAAHPSFHGSPLMLRRSYGYNNTLPSGQADSGLLFLSFQESLSTFIKTQQRMDEVDDLLRFATLRASMSYLVLPEPTSDLPPSRAISLLT